MCQVPESQPQTARSLMANYTRKWTHGANVGHINQEKGKKEKQSREEENKEEMPL